MAIFGSKKILIVEDEAELREAMTMVLKKEGYEAESISIGTQFPGAVVNFKPDLIILDISLPGLNGVDALRLLRTEMDQTVPVFVFTNMKLDAERAALIEQLQGVYLDKSGTSLAELLEKVKEVI